MSAETTTGRNSGRVSRRATEPLIWEEFLMQPCPGPAGTWKCALQLGHGGDHQRFAQEQDPESRITPHMRELLDGVRNLRQERDELLLTCADLLAAAKRALIFLQDNGMSHGADLARAIKAAER